MSVNPVTLWSDGIHTCLVRRLDVEYELVLHIEGRVMRRELCASRQAAELQASEWRMKFDGGRTFASVSVG